VATLPKGGSVSGGAGSLDAHLDDMTSEANLLSTMSLTLLDESNRVKNVVFDVDFIQSAPLSPATFATAETDVVLVAGELLLRSGELGALALLLHGAVTTYHATDAALAAAADGVKYAVGTVLGEAIGVWTLGAAAVGGVLYVQTLANNLGDELGRSFATAWTKAMANDPWSLLRNPAAGFTAIAAATMQGFDFNKALKETNSTFESALSALEKQAIALWPALRDTEFPSIAANALVALAPGLLNGLTGGSTNPASSLLGVALSGLSGGPWPPRTYEQTIDRLLGLANRKGLFEPTRVKVSEPIPFSNASAPTDISTLAQNLISIDQLSIGSSIDQNNPDYANIQIVQNGSGNYIVEIPSTLAWAPSDNHAPNDLTSNLQALSSTHQSQLMEAVLDAMKKEKIPAGSAIMLSGFSQGGIAAGALAEYIDKTPSLGYNVTHVVTFGAPIGQYDIPNKTQVISFEHSEDPVPATDGRSNPTQSNWTTLTSPTVSGSASAGAELPAHNATSYAKTAADWDKSGQEDVKRFESSASGFWSSHNNSTTINEYHARRD
jgi:hypothetical protein